MNTLFATRNDWTGLILRLTLGLIIFPHGAQKLLGWFGGYGFSGTMHYFTNDVHLPWIIGFLVILLESLGALLLIAGLGSRLIAGLMVPLLIGIIVTAHLEDGFFMNWFGNQKGEGYEYFLLAIGIALALIINGAGRYSLNQVIARAK
jgi:putative oxidoreductase